METGLILARFVHFASTMSLFGACFFAAALAPASLAPELSPLLRRFALPLALLSLASAVAWLIFVARSMAGGDLDLSTLVAVLSDTSFGAVWRARLAILVLLLLATLRPGARWRLPALASGLAMATLGLVGHAAMQEGALGAAHRLNHAVHLLTTSGWLGGLPLFVVCLRRFVIPPHGRDALCAMMRFSQLGHFAVALVFVSGGLDVAMTLHAFPWPPISPYRALLCVKIAIVALMTVIALTNRYLFAPRLQDSPAAARALAAGACAEFALGLVAVALVCVFATFEPK